MLHRRHGLPDGWESIADRIGWWPSFTEDEQHSLAEITDWLLHHKHWEAAHDFALTDEITVTIAVQAAMLVLGLDTADLREVSAIIVYPSAMQSRGVSAGPISGTVSDGMIPVLGEAHSSRGPLLLAWDETIAAAQHPGRGHNVVFHEFAHKLDMLFDDTADGMPHLGGRVQPDQWISVCTEAFDALQAGHHRPPLQEYGATNPAEFFAVATEAFFDVPRSLVHHEPALYDVLRGYYQQDPATRAQPDPKT